MTIKTRITVDYDVRDREHVVFVQLKIPEDALDVLPSFRRENALYALEKAKVPPETLIYYLADLIKALNGGTTPPDPEQLVAGRALNLDN